MIKHRGYLMEKVKNQSLNQNRKVQKASVIQPVGVKAIKAVGGLSLERENCSGEPRGGIGITPKKIIKK